MFSNPSLRHLVASVLRRRSFSRTSSAQKGPPDVGNRTAILGLNIDHVTREDMNLVLKPYRYVSSVPRRDSKSNLVVAFNHWMNLPDDLCDTIQQLFDFQYECELMLDDVYDESDYRRGLPTAHRLYGIHRTYIGGKLCLLLALRKLLELNNTKTIEAFAEEFIRHHVGQCKEIDSRDNGICPSVEQYERICAEKSQPVMSIVVKIMQAFSECKTDFAPLARQLGVYYQYTNDLSMLCEPKCWKAKGFCQDISEGKYSLAIIHAIESGTREGELVEAIVRRKTRDAPTLRYCLSLLDKLGSIDFARTTVTAAEKRLKEEVDRLGGNPPLVELIDALTSMRYDEEAEESFIDDSWSRQ